MVQIAYRSSQTACKSEYQPIQKKQRGPGEVARPEAFPASFQKIAPSWGIGWRLNGHSFIWSSFLLKDEPKAFFNHLGWNINSLTSRWDQSAKWVQFSSVAQPCLTLGNPMDCSMPGFPLHYQLPDIAQTHAHQVSDSIQPSHLLSSPSPPSCNLSQYQGLFQWVDSASDGQSIGASVSAMNIQDQYPLGLTGLISLQSKDLSRVFSNTTVPKHQFFGA